MIGQDNLIKKLNNFNLDNFPHTVLLNGPEGCGKHLYTSMIAEKLGIKLVDLTKNINLDSINDIILSTELGMYLIGVDDITEKSQNVILKFIEEPMSHFYIILLTTDKDSILSTVKNRCRVFDFEPYSKKELQQFLQDNNSNSQILIDICKTPGQIINLMQDNRFDSSFELANRLIDKYNVASYGNILNISDKIAFKKEEDKINYNSFLSILLYLIESRIKQNNEVRYYQLYDLTLRLVKTSKSSTLNKQYLFEKYLFDIKSIASGL